MSQTSELPKGTHITIDEHGKYLWRGTINPHENPTLIFLIAKVMGVVLGSTAAIFLCIGLACNITPEAWGMLLTVTSGVFLIVIAIAVIVTMLYVHALGGSFSADYAMDETGIVYSPAPSEQELNRSIAVGTAVASLLAGRLGLTAASIATMNSDAANVFAKVRRVKGIRDHDVIKVSQLFLYNQVYVAPEDYDFVYQFIASHCPKAKCYEV